MQFVVGIYCALYMYVKTNRCN